MLKISIISKTFRIHDNPFLDSDIYILYIDKKHYGEPQFDFLNQILYLHLKDLQKINIEPFLLSNINSIQTYLENLNESYELFIDHYYPNMILPYKKYRYIPSWTLIDWTDKVNEIKQWFLPEALKNHNVFKKYTHQHKRDIYSSKSKKNKIKYNLPSDFIISPKQKVSIPLPKKDLDIWIQKKLKETDFMNNTQWFKPKTKKTTSIQEENENNISATSKLSPFFSLGVLSPVLAYSFWNRENVIGSGRDQLLFRELFHACAQMPEFWKDTFGKEYNWKKKNINEWNNYIQGNTGRESVDWSMKKLKKEGWIHHLARHCVADYLTRGFLNYHWKYGAEWFKKTLIDHDEAVNRGNWMALSGTAFSSKQRSFYHYNYDTFIIKKTTKKNLKKK